MKIHLVAIALLVGIGSAFSGEAANPRIVVPISNEPAYIDIFYSEIPKRVQMIVHLSLKDVTDVLYEKYPSIGAELLRLQLQDEHPIKSYGSYYRRMEFFLADLNSPTEHGDCGQKVVLWFNTKGEMTGIYGSGPACPV